MGQLDDICLVKTGRRRLVWVGTCEDSGGVLNMHLNLGVLRHSVFDFFVSTLVGHMVSFIFMPLVYIYIALGGNKCGGVLEHEEA